MTSADHYRELAAELGTAASRSADEDVAAQLRQLAQSYARLAEQADKNSQADISAEIGNKPAGEGEGR